jgi:FkbM family methyltransferase
MLHAVKNLLKHSMIAQRTFRRYVQPRPLQDHPEAHILRGVKFDQCVEVGAREGAYTALLSRNANRVYAFEPARHLFDVLSALNIANVIAFNAALGSARGEAELFLPVSEREIDDARAMLRPSAAADRAEIQVRKVQMQKVQVQKVQVQKVQVQKVKVLKFDDFETQIDFDRIDFIKIGVGGAELEVLHGMERLLQLKNAALLIEIEQRHNPDYLQVFDRLGRLGYECYFTADGTRLQQLDVAELPDLQSPGRLAHDTARDVRPGERKNYISNIFFLQPGHKPRYGVAPAMSAAR